jgi:hypothetical protein
MFANVARAVAFFFAIFCEARGGGAKKQSSARTDELICRRLNSECLSLVTPRAEILCDQQNYKAAAAASPELGARARATALLSLAH